VIPAELRDRRQWVAWRSEVRVGRPTKVPVDPHTGGRASSVDPATWATYREALACVEADGIGFVFSADDPYVGVDMDNCVSRSGQIHPGAYRVVKLLSGYVEFSPSGHGMHVIVRGSLGRGRHTLATPWRDELAIYDRGRFFTMTDEGRGEPREAQDALSELIAFYFPEPDDKPPVAHRQPLCDDDAGVVDRIMGDARTAALWAGDTSLHGGDHSAADMALCAHLAYFTGNDAARIDALFRRSALFRDKWDEPRGDGTYGSITIERALRGRS